MLDQVARNQFEGRVKYIGDKGGGVLKDATLTIERFTKQDGGNFEIEIIGDNPIQMKAITTLQAKGKLISIYTQAIVSDNRLWDNSCHAHIQRA